MTMRVILRVTGPAIQHVGYRDAVKTIAKELGVKGTTQNLEDGSVEIICEGDEEILKQFIDKIKIEEKEDKQYFPRIVVGKVQEIARKETIGEFVAFSIKYANDSDKLQNIAEEISVGRKVTEDMAKNIEVMAKGFVSMEKAPVSQ